MHHNKTAASTLPTDACIILTYRCRMQCRMCNIWQHPSKKDEEFIPDLVNKISAGLKFINITGG